MDIADELATRFGKINEEGIFTSLIIAQSVRYAYDSEFRMDYRCAFGWQEDLYSSVE